MKKSILFDQYTLNMMGIDGATLKNFGYMVAFVEKVNISTLSTHNTCEVLSDRTR